LLHVRGARASGADALSRGALGRLGLAIVLVTVAAQHARLAAPFLRTDLVPVVLAHRTAAPADEVLAAVALGSHRLFALLGAALRPVGRGRRRLGGRLRRRLA